MVTNNLGQDEVYLVKMHNALCCKWCVQVFTVVSRFSPFLDAFPYLSCLKRRGLFSLSQAAYVIHDASWSSAPGGLVLPLAASQIEGRSFVVACVSIDDRLVCCMRLNASSISFGDGWRSSRFRQRCLLCMITAFALLTSSLFGVTSKSHSSDSPKMTASRTLPM